MAHNDTPSYLLPVIGFEARKAAQMAAYFATKAGKHGIEKLKLIKLFYLSERQFLTENGMPMLYDEFYSLPHGPICSGTLNGIDERIQNDVWAPYISRHGNLVFPQSAISREEMDEVSDAEVATLDAVWLKFGQYTASGVRNWTHINCAEYVEVGPGTRLPIEYVDVLEAVGFGRDEAEAAAREVQMVRRAESLFSV